MLKLELALMHQLLLMESLLVLLMLLLQQLLRGTPGGTRMVLWWC